MILFTNIKQFFIPQLVESFQSKFSGQIEVLKFQNKFFIKAGSIHQSGGWAESLFKNAMKKFIVGATLAVAPRASARLAPTNILILGLAGGTLVKLFTKMYPHINITGVDIDPVMVDIGKKYFGLNNYKNLKIEIADANQFVKENKNKHDLIFIDIFQGDKTPIEFSGKDFIKNVIKETSSGGHVMINRLYLPEFKKETDEFYKNLKNWQKELGIKMVNSYQNVGNKVLFMEKRDKI